jgi:hypothetical protein
MRPSDDLCLWLSLRMSTVSTTAPRPPHPVWSGLLSLLFWTCLLTAAVLYAGVALAPKIVAWRAWDRQHRANQLELVALESKTTQLEQVIAALKNDPQFAAELVRLEFDAQAPGEEVLPVSGSLTFHPHAKDAEAAHAVAVRAQRWDPWIDALATQPMLRRGCLAAAAGLILFGFTFLHDRRSARGRSLWQAVRERYSAE